jgi:hypothetical protein
MAALVGGCGSDEEKVLAGVAPVGDVNDRFFINADDEEEADEEDDDDGNDDEKDRDDDADGMRCERINAAYAD